MIFFHADRALVAYLHGELQPEDQQRVERHLARCARCRGAAVRLRTVHAALPDLPACRAPDTLWQRIEASLDSAQKSRAAAMATDTAESARSQAGQRSTPLVPRVGPNPRGAAQARNGSNPHRTAELADLAESLRRRGLTDRRKHVVLASVSLLAAAGIAMWAILQPRAPSWEVRTLQGRPVIGWFAFGEHGKLRVGDTLTTDRHSLAEIAVADIGTVKIAPGSRVRLAATGNEQHRLDLEQGALEAKVTAPPRLFVVDTRAGRAVDLGCAYRLETDGRQSTLLRVTLGEVALEDGGRSSLVPRGFTCESRRAGGLGTPLRVGASDRFREAVRRFDFESGGDASADQARTAAGAQDVITLWHMLRRCSASERGPLFNSMAALSRPPKSVTRAGIIAGDAKMLDDWKEAILYDLAESEINQ